MISHDTDSIFCELQAFKNRVFDLFPDVLVVVGVWRLPKSEPV